MTEKIGAEIEIIVFRRKVITENPIKDVFEKSEISVKSNKFVNTFKMTIKMYWICIGYYLTFIQNKNLINVIPGKLFKKNFIFNKFVILLNL